MTPQKSVPLLQTPGVLGEISNWATNPIVMERNITSASAGNIFGRVFTSSNGIDMTVGGTGKEVGVLASPQSFPGGALTSNTSYTAPQYSDASFVKFTSGMWVEVDTPVYGGGVQFNNDGTSAALGTLLAWVVGAAAAAHYTALTNARITNIGSTITGNVKMCEISILGAQ